MMEMNLDNFKFPPEVYEAVTDAVQRCPTAKEAAQFAFEQIIELPCYDELADQFAKRVVELLVHHRRGQINAGIRKSVGRSESADRYYDSVSASAKLAASSPEITRAVSEATLESIFDLNVGGSRLGNMTAKDLAEAQVRMRTNVEGRLGISLLLQNVRALVRGDKTVEQSIDAITIREIYRSSLEIAASFTRRVHNTAAGEVELIDQVRKGKTDRRDGKKVAAK